MVNPDEEEGEERGGSIGDLIEKEKAKGRGKKLELFCQDQTSSKKHEHVRNYLLSVKHIFHLLYLLYSTPIKSHTFCNFPNVALYPLPFSEISRPWRGSSCQPSIGCSGSAACICTSKHSCR